mmetsp:Transcript_4393/g.14427  ORF Transcript_4393/g.14427 Transcript_4393/m.14427 type:complete len:201 (+) Transcript_4393:2711-3313(+)
MLRADSVSLLEFARRSAGGCADDCNNALAPGSRATEASSSCSAARVPRLEPIRQRMRSTVLTSSRGATPKERTHTLSSTPLPAARVKEAPRHAESLLVVEVSSSAWGGSAKHGTAAAAPHVTPTVLIPAAGSEAGSVGQLSPIVVAPVSSPKEASLAPDAAPMGLEVGSDVTPTTTNEDTNIRPTARAPGVGARKSRCLI